MLAVCQYAVFMQIKTRTNLIYLHIQSENDSNERQCCSRYCSVNLCQNDTCKSFMLNVPSCLSRQCILNEIMHFYARSNIAKSDY
jgi:hypothetical protein